MSRLGAPIAVAALAAALSSGAAGCTGPPPPERAVGGVVEVTLDDFRIRPQRIVADRRRLLVRVRNEGRLPHNLHIRGRGGTRLEISTMLPGEGDEARVRLPRGEWRMFCAIGNHEEMGMYGTLVTR